jgi:hypothetical protein
MKLFSIFIFTFLLFFSSCKKRLFDTRNKYIGDYSFAVKKGSWVTGGSYTSSSYSYSGNITYGRKGTDILINFSNDAFIEVTTQKDDTWLGQKTSGKFESKTKVNFTASIGGLGGGDDYTVEGIKK